MPVLSEVSRVTVVSEVPTYTVSAMSVVSEVTVVSEQSKGYARLIEGVESKLRMIVYAQMQTHVF